MKNTKNENLYVKFANDFAKKQNAVKTAKSYKGGENKNTLQRLKKAGEVVEAFGLDNEKKQLFVSYVNKMKKTDKNIFTIDYKQSQYKLNDTIIKRQAEKAFAIVEWYQTTAGAVLDEKTTKAINFANDIKNGKMAKAFQSCARCWLVSADTTAKAKAKESAKQAKEKAKAQQAQAKESAKLYKVNQQFSTNLI